MVRVVTKWAYLNYGLEEPMDITELFSGDMDEGFRIRNISTAVDYFQGHPVVVVTALLED